MIAIAIAIGAVAAAVAVDIVVRVRSPRQAVGETSDTVGERTPNEPTERPSNQPSSAVGPGADKRLLRAVTHDLRTPIGTILGATELIDRQRELPPKVARWNGLIRSATWQLANMVDDLVWAADSERGRQRLGSIERIDLGDTVTTIVDELSTLPLGSHTVASIDDDADLTALTFAGPIRQLITNLISNAQNHGGGQSVAIAVFTADDKIVITVADGGSGIDPADLDALCESGVRGERAVGVGLGLGLSTARSVATALGLTIESTADATMKIAIPHRPPIDEPAIIVVDAGDRRRRIARAMEGSGVQVVAVDRGSSVAGLIAGLDSPVVISPDDRSVIGADWPPETIRSRMLELVATAQL